MKLIQIKTFTSEKSCNEWLERNMDMEILKYYSNGPDYFFIVYRFELKK